MMMFRGRYELERIFALVRAWARSRSRRVPMLSLQIGCPEVARTRRSGNPRALFHVGHLPGKVCCSPLAAHLDHNYLVGLILHEFGHPMAQKAWGRSEQEDADRAVKDFLGVKLSYKGPLLLECAPLKIVKQIIGHEFIPWE